MAVCLVTGASGYIGSFLVKQLLAEQHEVIALLREHSSVVLLPVEHPKLTIVASQDTIGSLKQIFNDQTIDVVFHLAAHISYDHSFDDIQGLINTNITLGAYLLELMTTFGCSTLVNAGSFFETGESNEYKPQCFYAATKFCFQNIIDYYAHIGQVKAITLRLMDTYGPFDPRNKLWPQLVLRLKNPLPLDLSKGEQLIDLVHINDVSRAFICAWKLLAPEPCGQHQVYYVASQKKQSLKTTVSLFEQIAGKKLPISWGARPYRPREIMNPFIGEVLPNWQADIDLQQGFYSLLQAEGILS